MKLKNKHYNKTKYLRLIIYSAECVKFVIFDKSVSSLWKNIDNDPHWVLIVNSLGPRHCDNVKMS